MLGSPRPHAPVPLSAPAPRLGRRQLVLGAGLATATTLAAPALDTDPAAGLAADLDGRRPRRQRRRQRGMARLTMSGRGIVQRRGVPFRAGGVNAFQLITNDYPTPRLMTREQVDAVLRKAVAMGAGVVRAHTLAASVGHPGCLVTGVSGIGPRPTVHYDQAVWDVIDHAVWSARQLGLYLVAPFVDELGYYHGGKRQWVDFRRPGSVSLDSAVKAAGSPAQRAAEDAFYTDPQVNWDFEQFIRDWLEHVNPLTGVAFKDEPVLSVVQIGNELWTAAQDAPGWVARKAALVKQVAPTTLVMDSGADGLAVEDLAWRSPHVDILETHPYTTFGAADVTRMAGFAAAHGKAFAVGEYPWSKPGAVAIEAAVRRSGNVFTSAPWSLQDDADLHNDGAGYGGDDVSLYVPGKDATQRAAVARLVAHDRALRRRAARAGRVRRARRRALDR